MQNIYKKEGRKNVDIHTESDNLNEVAEWTDRPASVCLRLGYRR